MRPEVSRETFHEIRFACNMPRRRRANPSDPIACESCTKPTTKPRKGLCFACYLRTHRGHEVNGPCAVCGIADRRVLRRHQLADGATVLCANHAAIAGRRAITLVELQREVFPPHDRRQCGRRHDDRRTHRDRRELAGDGWLIGAELERRGDGRRFDDVSG
jgi:hypothetical protein